jgi:hypothetical protein
MVGPKTATPPIDDYTKTRLAGSKVGHLPQRASEQQALEADAQPRKRRLIEATRACRGDGNRLGWVETAVPDTGLSALY